MRETMLKTEQIKVGGFYVKEEGGLVREVRDEKNGEAYYRSYSLGDGEPISGGVCSKYHLSQWADREATQEEAARMNRSQANAEDETRAIELIDKVLKNAPDAYLLAEVRRCGLN